MLQVRHPNLQHAFVAEFDKWFLAIKRLSRNWKQKKLADTAVPHLLSVVNPHLTRKVVSRAAAGLAKQLGE